MKSLGYLFVLLVFVGLVGFFRGWFTVEASAESGRADVKLGVDGDKIAEDTRLSKKVPSAATGGAVAAAPSITIEGRITAVDAAAQDLTLEVLDQRAVHHVGAATTRRSRSRSCAPTCACACASPPPERRRTCSRSW